MVKLPDDIRKQIFNQDVRKKMSEKRKDYYAKMTPEEIVDSLTLEQKTAQMLLPAVYNIDDRKCLKLIMGLFCQRKNLCRLPNGE